MNVISFSLWGDEPLYVRGMEHNIKLAEKIYPGWKVWIFHCYESLQPFGWPGVTWLKVSSDRKNQGLFWRFSPMAFTNVSRFIVRDSDSRLNVRERAAVEEWMSTDYPIHSMRDNEQHTVPIMGGMWGARGGLVPDIIKQMDQWGRYGKGTDQEFLGKRIWPLFHDKILAHDQNPERALRLFGPHECRPFPDHLETKTQYVGEVCHADNPG